MFRIEPAPYGFKLTFSGYIQAEEMKAWHQESKTVLASARKGFGVVVDMVKMGVMPQDTKAELAEGQALYRAKGMGRSAVLVPSLLVAKQLKDDAAKSGILPNERYLGAEDPGALAKAINWVKDGKEPVQTA